ncbi:hypothetical protein NG726_02505 [Pseudomonas sp. MOB-449]|nr:hypothetical protein [Pseudomonas sp. MOB-449]
MLAELRISNFRKLEVVRELDQTVKWLHRACDRIEPMKCSQRLLLWRSLMQPRAPQVSPSVIEQYEAEARRLAGQVSANQRRFLKVGLEKGKELEPTGRLAGPHT